MPEHIVSAFDAELKEIGRKVVEMVARPSASSSTA